MEVEKRMITSQEELAQQHLTTILSKVIGQASDLTSLRAQVETATLQISTVEKKLAALKDIYSKFKQDPLN